MKAKSLFSISWEESPVWLRCLGVFAILNFFACWIAAVLLGGDAVNGKIEKGHYFLRSHAHLQEVSASVFFYSRIHCVSALAGVLVLLIAVVQFKYRKS